MPLWNAGAGKFIPPEPEGNKGGGYVPRRYDHRSRILREDEEILTVIMAYMETKH